MFHDSQATLDEKAKIGERVFVKCLAGKGADQGDDPQCVERVLPCLNIVNHTSFL